MWPRWLVYGVVLPLLAVGAIAAALVMEHQRWLGTPFADAGQLASVRPVLIAPGTPFRGVVRQLTEAGVLIRPRSFEFEARRRGLVNRLQAGEYAIEPQWTPLLLLEAMRQGRVVQHPFTLIEGWTFRQVRAALARTPTLRHDTLDWSDAEIMARLGSPEQAAEGWFFPDTYLHTRGESDLAVLRRAHQTMQSELAAAWARRQADLPFDAAYQALILASIIERETGRSSERHKVSGVFVRRLREGMRLQTDPTVIYGLGEDFQDRLRRADLRRDTPYNTYTRHGLPPTPIAMPGRAALLAAVDPHEGAALYFVARGDGSHHFSATYAEHNAAIQRYILRRP
jgi:UPF0755 protein